MKNNKNIELAKLIIDNPELEVVYYNSGYDSGYDLPDLEITDIQIKHFDEFVNPIYNKIEFNQYIIVCLNHPPDMLRDGCNCPGCC